MTDNEHHPPAYLSKKSLAHELDCAESTVDELVKRGILPKPLVLSSGCVRWCWESVVMSLTSLGEPGAVDANDPYLERAKNVTEISTRGR